MDNYSEALQLQDIDHYLQELGVFENNEFVTDVSIPGEGNMNLVLRVKTNQNRSIILKKSFGFVNKYPQVKAPINRLGKEYQFYKSVSLSKVYFPEIISFDEQKNILIQTDLGQNQDYSSIYTSNVLTVNEVDHIIDFLINLHQIEQPHKFENEDMQQLNHAHIFEIPFLHENGLNLDQFCNGLQDFASDFKSDDQLADRARKLGESYLQPGNFLLHGDYYPGSWLKTDDGFKVIDPEFCFFGPREFDLGVCLAHFKMANVSSELISYGLERYTAKIKLDLSLLNGFIGVEIIRRFLGVAQLPLNLSLEQRKSLLGEAKKLMFE